MNNRDHDELLSVATDRFERRLGEECGKQRTETGQLRLDVVTQGAEIRADVSALRVEMTEQFATAKVDAANRHRDLLKWALMFWMGQAAALAAVVSAIGYFLSRR